MHRRDALEFLLAVTGVLCRSSPLTALQPVQVGTWRRDDGLDEQVGQCTELDPDHRRIGVEGGYFDVPCNERGDDRLLPTDRSRSSNVGRRAIAALVHQPYRGGRVRADRGGFGEQFREVR